MTKEQIARQMILIYAKREHNTTANELLTLSDLIEFAQGCYDEGYRAGMADRNSDAETTPVVEDVSTTLSEHLGLNRR